MHYTRIYVYIENWIWVISVRNSQLRVGPGIPRYDPELQIDCSSNTTKTDQRSFNTAFLQEDVFDWMPVAQLQYTVYVFSTALNYEYSTGVPAACAHNDRT